MSTQLSKAPVFVTARSGTGAIAADSATLSDANYPLANGVAPYGAASKICAYWYASGGTPHVMDSIDLQILLRDAKNPSSSRWVEGQTQYGVRSGDIVDFDTLQCSEVYLRIVAINMQLAPEGIIVQAATAIKE